MTLRIFKREACRKLCQWHFIPPLCKETYKMTKTQYVLVEILKIKRNPEKERDLIRNHDFQKIQIKSSENHLLIKGGKHHGR